MNFIKTNWMGILFCLAVAVPAAILGKLLPVIGGPVFGILFGMILALIIKKRDRLDKGVSFTSKKILQYAVILLGFGMNLKVVMETGKQSLPIIICTISTSLIVAYFLHKALKMPGKISTLIGVGSSICGGSAVAATAPVIDADEEEVAQAISVIFLFNILAALIFPALGNAIGFATDSGEAFGIFAGTAVNDTSSVTAAASTWDSMHNLGSQTLDKAVTVKLTRTLAIIPITLVLAFYRLKKAEKEAAKAVAAGAAGTDNKAGGEITGASEGSSLTGAEKNAAGKVSMKKVFPFFILFFIAASLITTIAVSFGVPVEAFNPLKELSKFFIIMAMSAIGFNTNIVKLLKSGLKPVILGFACWIGITAVTLCMQHFMNIL